MVLIIFSLFASFENTSASTNDSLITKLESSEGKEKVKILFELFREKINENPELARKYSEEALKISIEENIESYITYSYLYIGLSYYFKNQWRISNDYYLKALQTNFSKSNTKINASLVNNIALNYKFLSEYEKSLTYLFEALKKFELVKDSSSIAMTRGNIGVLYIKLKKPDESIEHFNFSLPILTKLKDSINIANTYENLSDAFFKSGEIETSKKYFNLAEKMMFEIKDSIGISRLYYEYGENLFSVHFFNEALRYFTKSITFCDESLTPHQYYLSLEGQGKASIYSGKINDAEKLLKLAKEGFLRMGATESIWMNNLDLSKLYSRKGNWEKFNEYFNLYDEKRNTQLREKEINTVSELNLIYQTEKKNRQIEFQNIEIENKNNKILLLSIIAFLVTVGLFVALYLSRKLKFANRNLIEKNLELSERWNQLQKFYGSSESDFSNKTQNELFHRIYQLMVNEQVYTKHDITVDYLSKQLNSNTKYISNAIKEETGMNFNTFINTFRIEEAKKILRDRISSSWSLDAVAVQSGFNNTTSFFQAFKKNTGLTPSAFRNALVTSIYE
ncbi:MAG: tetratricopeptide repeat protein [Bacteroidetes bacterium]|nr:tetratricopeptide repeat protein [Bacteroidota bacterium]